MTRKEVDYKYVIYFLIFSLTLYLSFLVIKPYIVSVLTAGVLAFLFFPLYRFINRYIKHKNLSALVLILLLLFIIVVPLVLLTNALLKEAVHLFNYVQGYNFSLLLPDFVDAFKEEIELQLSNVLAVVTGFVVSSVTQFLISIPQKLLQLVVLLFTFYYLLVDHEKVVGLIYSVLPFEKRNKEILLKEFKEVTYALVFGTVVTSLVQGVVATLGFYIFGVPNPLLLGLAVIVVGVLPLFGPTLIWLPAGLYLIFIENNLTYGILLMVYCVLFISTLDHLLKPKLVSKHSNVHPLLVVIGVLGGIGLFGFFGLFLGPLILVFLVKFLKIYGLKKEIDHVVRKDL